MATYGKAGTAKTVTATNAATIKVLTEAGWAEVEDRAPAAGAKPKTEAKPKAPAKPKPEEPEPILGNGDASTAASD